MKNDQWFYLDPSELYKGIPFHEWIQINYKYPPSFFDVWVLIGNKKKKAYLDSPNHAWMASTKNVWVRKELQNVIAWKVIKRQTFKKQLKKSN